LRPRRIRVVEDVGARAHAPGKYSSSPDAAYGVTNARAAANALRIRGSKSLRIDAVSERAIDRMRDLVPDRHRREINNG